MGEHEAVRARLARALLLSIGAAVALAAAAGCRLPAGDGTKTGPREVATRAKEDDVAKTYGAGDRDIAATMGERFVIALEANPATGYQWAADFETDRLRLVDRSVRPASASQAPPGAPKTEEFTFEALAAGETSIRLEYRRPWEDEPAEVLDFRVDAAPWP